MANYPLENYELPSEFRDASLFNANEEAIRRDISVSFFDKISTGITFGHREAPGMRLLNNWLDGDQKTGKMISKEDANARYPVPIDWDADVDEGYAKYISEKQKRKAVQMAIMDSPSSWGNTALKYGPMFVGGIFSPENLLSLGIAGTGATLASQIGRGMLAGMAENAILTPLQAYVAKKEQEPYTSWDVAQDIAIGGLFGGAMPVIASGARAAWGKLSNKAAKQMLTDSSVEQQVGAPVDHSPQLKVLDDYVNTPKEHQSVNEHVKTNPVDIKNKPFYVALDDFSAKDIEQSLNFDSVKLEDSVNAIDDFTKIENALLSPLEDNPKGATAEVQLKENADVVDLDDMENPIVAELMKKMEKQENQSVKEFIKDSSAKDLKVLNEELKSKGVDAYTYEGGTNQNPHNSLNILNKDAVEISGKQEVTLDNNGKVKSHADAKEQIKTSMLSQIEDLKKAKHAHEFSEEALNDTSIDSAKLHKATDDLAEYSESSDAILNDMLEELELLGVDKTKIEDVKRAKDLKTQREKASKLLTNCLFRNV